MQQMNDEMLIRFLLKESSSTEQVIVQDWLSSSTANASYFAQLEKIWQTSKDLQVLHEVDVEAAWMKFKGKTIAQVKVRPLFTWLRIAAALLIAIGTWAVYGVFAPTKYTDLVTNGQVLSQRLPDGSALTLNKFSQVSYASDFKDRRSIKLNAGEVFFNVAKDKDKPFVVNIDEIAVEVVGTSFNVKHLDQQTEVMVESGVVKISLRDEEITLYKGESITLNAQTKHLQKNKTTDQLYNYYHSQLFITDNTPLPKLITTLNAAYGSAIKLDPAIQHLTISTTLKYNSLAINLKIICETLDLKITRNQKEILLSNSRE